MRSHENSWRHLLGNPRMQILIPSSTPLQVSWCIIRGHSTWWWWWWWWWENEGDEGDRKFHLSRLLVGVWHKATHKVGLAVVQGGLHKNMLSQNMYDIWYNILLCRVVCTRIYSAFSIRLNRIVHYHQLNEWHKVDRGDSLAAALLLLLSLLLRGGGRLARVVWEIATYYNELGSWQTVVPSQSRTSRVQEDWDFMISTTLSLTGSLFFSSHPVTL